MDTFPITFNPFYTSSPISTTIFLSVLLSALYVVQTELFFKYSLYLYKLGKVKRLTRLHFHRDVSSSFLQIIVIIFPTVATLTYFGAHINDYNPSLPSALHPPFKITRDIHPLSIIGLTTLFLFIADTYFFHLHLLVHNCKPLYRLLHARHHNERSVTAWSTGIAHLLENIILVTPSWVAWTYYFCSIASKSGELNLWNWAVPLYTASYIFILGHSGYISASYKLSLPCPILPLLVLFGKPFNLIYLRPVDHELHHLLGIGNYGLFFRHWDVVWGTWKRFRNRRKVYTWEVELETEKVIK